MTFSTGDVGAPLFRVKPSLQRLPLLLTPRGSINSGVMKINDLKSMPKSEALPLSRPSNNQGLDADYLIAEARNELENIRDPIEQLRQIGVTKELRQRNSSNIVVTYPTKFDLDRYDGGNVFSDLASRSTLRALYLHIPFCTGICTYCSFARSAASEDDPRISNYLKALGQESSLVRAMSGGQKIRVDSIYLGGGTPTLLTPQHLQQVLELIERDYELTPGGEFTLEGSPETITRPKIALAKLAGVNRVSFGVESFDDQVLKTIGRRHSHTDVIRALDDIRSAGIDNIDLDLIRGLPGYTPEMIVSDVNAVIASGVPSVTSYQYSLKPRSIDAARNRNGMAFDPDQQLLMHATFLKGMEVAGFTHGNPLVDVYVKEPGKHGYSHNTHKWRDMCDLIGLGQGSYGYINGTQYINYEGPTLYEGAVGRGLLPIEKATALPEDEILRRKMIFGLKSSIDRIEFARQLGPDPLATSFRTTIEQLERAGGLEVTEGTIRLSKAGRYMADWIMMQFYSETYRRREATRMNLKLLDDKQGK